jgi:von Willebrand factor A domain-containing protein 8
MNTAGLGGAGGPYRLDSGNAVFQISDFDKNLVPEEVLLTSHAKHFLI